MFHCKPVKAAKSWLRSGGDLASISSTHGDWVELRDTSEDQNSIGVSSDDQMRKKRDWRCYGWMQRFAAVWQGSVAGERQRWQRHKRLVEERVKKKFLGKKKKTLSVDQCKSFDARG